VRVWYADACLSSLLQISKNSGSESNGHVIVDWLSTPAIRLTVDLLGLGEWFEKWRKANRQAFASLPEYPDRDTPWARKLRKVKQESGRKKS
jgi:hypothetical protein